jgi:hypothetical protein
MKLPGFSADASLSASSKEYGTRAVVHGAVRSLVTPQGCPPWVAVGCVAAIAACVASCAAGPEACIACFAGIGASNCLSCVQ